MANVLVIDDSLLTRRKIKQYLTEAGHEILEAENGQIALDVLEKEKDRIDCILTDLLMPVMNGFQFLENYKLEIPVVVLSSDIQNASKEKVFRLGAKAMLNKPCKPEVLCSTIDRLVG
ncbi:MAG: response regulator [Lentisphaeria bacterium]|nr:response regulator [Lentisphaeria bacterium]